MTLPSAASIPSANYHRIRRYDLTHPTVPSLNIAESCSNWACQVTHLLAVDVNRYRIAVVRVVVLANEGGDAFEFRAFVSSTADDALKGVLIIAFADDIEVKRSVAVQVFCCWYALWLRRTIAEQSREPTHFTLRFF